MIGTGIKVQRRDDGGSLCPFCRAEVVAGERVLSCARCGTRHHVACTLEVERCTVMACGGSFAAQSFVKLAPAIQGAGAAATTGTTSATDCGSGCGGFLIELVGEIVFQGVGELVVALITGL